MTSPLTASTTSPASPSCSPSVTSAARWRAALSTLWVRIDEITGTNANPPAIPATPTTAAAAIAVRIRTPPRHLLTRRKLGD